MTRAVLFAGSPGGPGDSPGPALLPHGDRTVIDRLRGQLHDLGVADIVVLARGRDAKPLRAAGFTVLVCEDTTEELRTLASLAEEGHEALVLCAGNLVASATTLGAVVAVAGSTDAALVLPPQPEVPPTDPPGGRPAPSPAPPAAEPPADEPPVRQQRGLLVDVDLDDPTGAGGTPRFGGLLAAGPGRIRTAAATCLSAGSHGDALSLVLRAMVRTGEPVKVQRTPGLPSARVSDAASLTAVTDALDTVDEDGTRLRLSVKRQDDLFATYCVSSYTPYLVRWAARAGLTPTTVTWVSLGVAALAASAFAHGARPWLAVGAVLLYASFVFDCVDGQLARYLQRYSSFGGWLDSVADRGKEYLVYAGLAVGATRTGATDVWPLALAAMVLLTTRHMTDTWYGVLQNQAVARQARQVGADAQQPQPGAGDALSRAGAFLGEASHRVQSNRKSIAYWLKRTIPLPIGERWMLLAVVTVLFDARTAFLALLTWGALAACYTLLGRTLRTTHMRVAVLAGDDTQLYRDDGVVARLLGGLGRGSVAPLPASLLPALVAAAGVAALLLGAPLRVGGVAAAAAVALCFAGLASGHRHDGPRDWLVPAALRISEYAVVILIGTYAGLPTSLVYGLLAVVVIFHYDLTARRERDGSPVSHGALALGWDGRVLVLGLSTLLGGATIGFTVLAVYLATLFVLSAAMGTLAANRGDRRPAATSEAQPADYEVPVKVP